MSYFLLRHGLQHTRLPCPSLSSRVCSNSCPLIWWCYPTISFSVVPFFSFPQSFPVSKFSSESALCIKWPKYWTFNFSIGPSNEYSGLISFRIDWIYLPAVQGILKSLSQHHSSKASILQLFSLLYGPTPRSIHDYWKNIAIVLTIWTFVGKVMSAF